MFCGFGSVILLVMIINSHTVSVRQEVHDDRRGEVVRLERQVLEGERFKVELRNALADSEQQVVTAQGLSERVLSLIARTRQELAGADQETSARIAHINALKTDLKTLDEDTKRLSAQAEKQKDQGAKARQHLGDGDRQYLTGLKVGGDRVLILVDASASMLDKTIVNIIRRRNMSDVNKRRSPKWQQTVATVEWLISQLPVTGSYQIYVFNTQARPLLADSAGRWLATADSLTLDKTIAELRKVIPAGGTSLHNVFALLRELSPRPDNVLLLTDGLPTQGASKPLLSSKVSGEQRLRLFEDAITRLPRSVPVNTILFPLEGDPLAASAFWKLAVVTQGSFLSPSKDWP